MKNEVKGRQGADTGNGDKNQKCNEALEQDFQERLEWSLRLARNLMGLFLLAVAFFLPGYAAQRNAQETLSETTKLSTEGSMTPQEPVIVIDAGHGGDDPGMTGQSGVTERELNLVFAKKLEQRLVDEGYRVVQTRTTEEGLYDSDASHKKAQDMQRRVAVIEKEAPLLTVSLHQNSYPDASVYGPQVFYYEHSAEGEKLAVCIQSSLNEALQIGRPRVQKSNGSYYILKRSRSVTVIVECGFLSNPGEEAKLQENAYQDQVAAAICTGIMEYCSLTKSAES